MVHTLAQGGEIFNQVAEGNRIVVFLIIRQKPAESLEAFDDDRVRPYLSVKYP